MIINTIITILTIASIAFLITAPDRKKKREVKELYEAVKL
jgi:hypothetical protein